VFGDLEAGDVLENADLRLHQLVIAEVAQRLEAELSSTNRIAASYLSRPMLVRQRPYRVMMSPLSSPSAWNAASARSPQSRASSRSPLCLATEASTRSAVGHSSVNSRTSTHIVGLPSIW
jgi:hypothetical protein